MRTWALEIENGWAEREKAWVKGVTPYAIRVAPEGDPSAAGHMGEQVPLETSDGGHI